MFSTQCRRQFLITHVLHLFGIHRVYLLTFSRFFHLPALFQQFHYRQIFLLHLLVLLIRVDQFTIPVKESMICTLQHFILPNNEEDQYQNNTKADRYDNNNPTLKIYPIAQLTDICIILLFFISHQFVLYLIILPLIDGIRKRNI